MPLFVRWIKRGEYTVLPSERLALDESVIYRPSNCCSLLLGGDLRLHRRYLHASGVEPGMVLGALEAHRFTSRPTATWFASTRAFDGSLYGMGVGAPPAGGQGAVL